MVASRCWHWEMRGPSPHFGHSMMMAGVAVDRAIRSVEHEQVCRLRVPQLLEENGERGRNRTYNLLIKSRRV